MRGTVTEVDAHFTHVTLESGKLEIFNHLGCNACPVALRKPGTAVVLERNATDMVFHCLPAPAVMRVPVRGTPGLVRMQPPTPTELKVPVRKRPS